MTEDVHTKRVSKDKILMICDYWYRIFMDDDTISIDNISELMAAYYNFMIAYRGKFIAAIVMNRMM